jgi:DNA invertase Pin-like site-specific DNA recombinase
MAKVGYGRVSSIGQSLDVQKSKLDEFGCDKIYLDKHTGTTADRPKLKEARNYVRQGDSLVVTKLDRLARSTNHLTTIAAELEQKDVDLVVLDQDIDTSTPIGKLLFNVLASIAEFETEIRKERQMEGIAKAKERGIQFGRKPKLQDQEIEQLRRERENGVKITELMSKYSISKASVYRLLT